MIDIRITKLPVVLAEMCFNGKYALDFFFQITKIGELAIGRLQQMH